MVKYFKLLSILILFFIATRSHSDWQKINSFPTFWVNDIYISGGVLYAATSNNGIYRSTDGTQSWQPISNGLNNPQAIQCNQIIFSGNALYTATVDGIYKSGNGGTNWNKMSSGITIGPGAIYEFCESIYELGGVLYTGAFNGIYRSTNGGVNWLLTNVSGMHIWAKNFTLHNGTIFAARESGNLPRGYFSTNSGLTWSELTTMQFPTITFLSEGNNLFAGTIHGAWLSTDNGASWIHRMQGLTSDPYNSSFVRVNTTLVTSLKFGGSGVFKSTNDGLLWVNFGQGLPFLASIDELVIFNNKILAATSGGIYERNTSEVTGINQISAEIPGAFSLAQNYPNPFNPETKIRYTVARQTHVSLKVYNAEGQELTELVNQTQNPGTYEVSFNASSLASGLYFYKISADGFTDTKRMILVK